MFYILFLRKWGGLAAVFFIFYFQSPTIEITTRLDINGKTHEWLDWFPNHCHTNCVVKHCMS
jgi:hypothetical protein